MKKILLTGATGFVGSNILENFYKDVYGIFNCLYCLFYRLCKKIFQEKYEEKYLL